MRLVGYKNGTTAASLFDGLGAVVTEVLGIKNYKHRSALFDIGERGAIPSGMVPAIYEAVQGNWPETIGSTSRQNWRWRIPQLTLAPHNRSPEVMLERRLMAALEAAGRTDWSNQIPIASGVLSPDAERRRALDLVCHKGPGWFEFVELKVGSDTPLYAAVEIIAYTVIWLLSRRALGHTKSVLLDAMRIDARVLAPASYYERYQLEALQNVLDAELQELGRQHGVELTFAYIVFSGEMLNPDVPGSRRIGLLDARAPL